MTDLIITSTDSNYVKQYNKLQVYQGDVDQVTKLPHGKGRIKYLDLILLTVIMIAIIQAQVKR